MSKRRLLFITLSLSFIAIHHVVFAADDPKTVANLLNLTNILWTCLAAFLVFFMQAGFAMVEAGMTRAKNASNIIMKNLLDFSVGSLAFWLIGASIMFGAHKSFGWFAGDVDFFLSGYLKDADMFTYANLIFQTVFAATAATIASGAMAERTKFSAYLIYSVVVTAFIYPVFGSWSWNSLWGIGGDVKGWLENVGFVDFAGSTVVHSVGAWVGLAGTIMLGPRRGRYVNGAVKPIPGHNMPLAGLGVFILWLGWFGFNPGSTTAINDGSLAKIAVTTNLSAAAGAIGSLLTGWILLRKPDVGISLNGALAGLVGITAGCASTSPGAAAIIGFTSGIIVVLSVLVFDKLKIDDPVGAISVHGVVGAWGTLFLAVFDPAATFMGQLYGVLACFGWSFGVGLVLFFLIKVTIGLRVNEEEEAQGLDLSEHSAEAYADFRIAQR